jgi:hypothetical protein
MIRNPVPLTLLLACSAALIAGGCGNGGRYNTTGDESKRTDKKASTGRPVVDSAASDIDRDDIIACLSDAGLDPQDTGRMVIGSSSGSTEAIGVQLDSGKVVIWPPTKNGDASYPESKMQEEVGGTGVVTEVGVTVIGFENPPTDEDRETIEGCASAKASSEDSGAGTMSDEERARELGELVEESREQMRREEQENLERYESGDRTCPEGKAYNAQMDICI